MRLYKLLNLFVPTTLFFEDGSRVDYISRNDTLRYISPSGYRTQVPLLFDKITNVQRVDLPASGVWEKPLGKALSTEEMDDLKFKIAMFIGKVGKPFTM